MAQVKRTDGRINIVPPQPLLIVGDVRIEFTQKVDILNPWFVVLGDPDAAWMDRLDLDLA